ncbi:hypothetical protein QWZ13_03945 [Reinekea marina]|uniref:hypothetical protein n=1 Tax=Reinekea marina TaxID=1310421 RepID=UPI0025B3FC7D|nr:hypothetical protein [Reinekea marina]MDN3648054.1 hypothetical protein [Reinekea marina]
MASLGANRGTVFVFCLNPQPVARSLKPLTAKNRPQSPNYPCSVAVRTPAPLSFAIHASNYRARLIASLGANQVTVLFFCLNPQPVARSQKPFFFTHNLQLQTQHFPLLIQTSIHLLSMLP